MVVRQNLLCDVVLVADGLEIPAHRAVLAACSPYFYAMFTGDLAEARAERIVLQEMDGKALALLVEFMYTAEIQVTEENVQVCSVSYLFNSYTIPIYLTVVCPVCYSWELSVPLKHFFGLLVNKKHRERC